ncbi:MAG: DUF4278 domain-containing protein [Cyanobacteria bacterium J06607_15]
MKLQFLGQVYEPTPAYVTTLPLQRQATFRGKNYQLRRSIIMPKSTMPANVRKYRGVIY